MTPTPLTTPTDQTPTAPEAEPDRTGEWDLDVSFVEGSDVDTLIYMTDDGCGQTCQSACSTTCR